MGLTASNASFDANNAYKFVFRRLLRIAPPYYFSIIFALAILYLKSIVIGSPFYDISLNSILHHVTFSQGIFGSPHINIIFWTLCIEVQFYIAFALLLWLSDYLESKFIFINRFLTITTAFIFSILWPLKITFSVLWTGGFIGFWYSFLLGVSVSMVMFEKKHETRLATWSFCLTVLTIGVLQQSDFAICSGLTASLLLVAFMRNKMASWLNFKWLQKIGLISYSLYLLHNPITGVTTNIIKRVIPESLLGNIFNIIIVIGVCILISYFSFLLIEKPSIQLSHKIKLRKNN